VDRKEGLYLGTEHSDDHPKVKEEVPTHGKNQFPDALVPEMRATALQYLDAVTELGQQVMEVISVSLGLDPQYFRKHWTQEPVILLRLWNYPPPAQPDSANQGIGEHTDYGLLTILKQEAPGLQFKSPGHEWVDVPPIENTFMCNVGDLLDGITAGRFKSRAHRVLLVTDKPRLSFACFF
jgi:isopenicillin N synthase-like dioxygenase